MRRKVDYVAPGLNLTPVWMTRDLSKVTTKPVMVPMQLAFSKYKFGTTSLTIISFNPRCSGISGEWW